MGNFAVSKEFAFVVIAILAVWFLGPHILFSAAEKSRETEIDNFHKAIQQRRDSVAASIKSLGVTDPNLLACIEAGSADRASVSPNGSGGIDDVRELTSLFCVRRKISSLKGISELTALEHLDLSENDIKDIEPLKTITALQSLNLRDNPISNIQPLAKLAQLKNVTLPVLPNMRCSDIRKIIGSARTSMQATQCKDGSSSAIADSTDSWWETSEPRRDDSPSLSGHEEAELREFERNARQRYQTQ